MPVCGSSGATWRSEYGRHRRERRFDPGLGHLAAAGEEVRERRAGGHVVFLQHPALEARHPFDRRRVGEVGGFDQDFEVAGGPGRFLEGVQVFDLAQVVGGELADFC